MMGKKFMIDRNPRVRMMMGGFYFTGGMIYDLDSFKISIDELNKISTIVWIKDKQENKSEEIPELKNKINNKKLKNKIEVKDAD